MTTNQILLILSAFFLPLFPFSMLFNALFAAARPVILRIIILLAWPQIGLTLVLASDAKAPAWVMSLAVATSILYAFRALTIRAVNQWTAYLAISIWSLAWITFAYIDEEITLRSHILGTSLPLVMLALLAYSLETRFGAAYTGIYNGLAQSMPRFSAILVVVILAIIASPVFPAFTSILLNITLSIPAMPVIALLLLVSWIFWSWAGARLIQGLIVGNPQQGSAQDLSLSATWLYSLALMVLLAGGLYLMGDLV